MDLTVRLGRLELANPVVAASGTCGYVREMAALADVSRLGAVIPKTVTREPRRGNPPPRIVETASGMLNAIGLDNDGLDHFCREHLPYLEAVGTAVIANIAGRTIDEFVEMAARLDRYGWLAAIELNISCPNVAHGTDFAVDPDLTRTICRRTCDATSLPVIAKLTPNVTDVVAVAQAAADGGAEAVSLVNTFLGMAVDWRRREPILANVTGGLSGPAIKPLALRAVWQVASRVDVPVIGIGGIRSIDDCMDYFVAGASAVQVGTANFLDPSAAVRLVDALPGALREAGVETVGDLVGTLRTPTLADPPPPAMPLGERGP